MSSQAEPTAGTRLERWAKHPAGPALLALFAALEACVFPAPTEALMVALSLARPGRSWRLALIAVCGSLAGSLCGYALGFYGQEHLRWALDGAGAGRIAALGEGYRAGAFWLLATSGFTPVPYLAYTIAAGVYRIPLVPFVAGAVAGRALKYFLLGAVTYSLGPFVRRALVRAGPRGIAAAVVVALIAAWVLSAIWG